MGSPPETYNDLSYYDTKKIKNYMSNGICRTTSKRSGLIIRNTRNFTHTACVKCKLHLEKTSTVWVSIIELCIANWSDYVII